MRKSFYAAKVGSELLRDDPDLNLWPSVFTTKALITSVQMLLFLYPRELTQLKQVPE